MPKKVLKKILPSHEKIKKQKYLKIFGNLINKQELWSLNRKKVLGGVFIGIFVGLIPMPLQIILVTLLAILLQVNLPIAFLLIWIANPLTMPFIYYIEYELGNFILNKENTLEFSLEVLSENLSEIALSLYTGTLVLCFVVSSLSVMIINFLWIKKVKKKRKNKYIS